ncbi:MAG: hypothetical protein NXI19_06585 [Alphaproteobacteria bacterium]|nr:hypothetical protein [Alphaproteobacteria bacterium]
MKFFDRNLVIGLRNSVPKLFGLGGLLLLSGCATTEFYQARDACRAEWYARIPERIEQRLVNETRYEERFTGETVCTTNNDVTNCVQQTRRVPVTYPVVKNFDLNEPKRTPRINACVIDLCLNRFGNPDCKP